MRSLSESRRGSKVTNNLFLVILESAIVCFFCLFLCEIVDRFDFRRSRGRSAGSFPKQRLIEPRLGRYFWPLFVVTFHGVGSGFARWETLVNFYCWVIDGYASKHNNHDRLYCGNLRFWPPCVEEDQAWSRDGQVFIGWDAVKVNNTKKKPISSHLDQICGIHYMGKKKLFVVGSTFRGMVWDFEGVHVFCCQFCPFSMVQILFPFVFGYGNIW